MIRRAGPLLTDQPAGAHNRNQGLDTAAAMIYAHRRIVDDGGSGTMDQQLLRSRAGRTGRAQLIQAACRLMAERGTVDISIHDIAQASGMSSALIKYHFGHKDGLLMAVLEKVIGDNLAHLEVLVDKPIPPTEKLRLHVEGVLGVYARHPYVNRLIHSLLASSEEARERISSSIVTPLLAAQARILAEGASTGAFRPVDPTLFYFHLIGACDHLFFGHCALRSAFGPDGVTQTLQKRYASHLVGSILDGIRPR